MGQYQTTGLSDLYFVKTVCIKLQISDYDINVLSTTYSNSNLLKHKKEKRISFSLRLVMKEVSQA